MTEGNQNFLDRILDKRATYGETVILSGIIGFLIYYFLGDVNSIESDGKYAVILTGFPILFIIKKTYWTFRMKSFLLKSKFDLEYNTEALLRYYRNHAWRNVNYYYGYIKRDLNQ